MDIWQTLKDLGFEQKVIKPTKWQKFLNFFYKEPKYKDIVCEYYYQQKEIDGKYLIEVYIIDIWYVQISVDGKVVFDKRRFEDEEFVNIINTLQNERRRRKVNFLSSSLSNKTSDFIKPSFTLSSNSESNFG
jgi:AAA+ superfamily predicted ATPase